MSGSSFSVGSILGIGSGESTNPILQLRKLQERISTAPALSRNDLATRMRLTNERNGLTERSSLFSSLKTEIEKLNTLSSGLSTSKLVEKSKGTNQATVSSSNTSVASASISGTVSGGTFGINVKQLAAAASLGGASIQDIFNSRQLSDVLAVRNANVQQSQTASAASLVSGAIEDIYYGRQLGGSASVQGADVVQSQTATAASFQGADLPDITTARELSDSATVKSALVIDGQEGRAASLQGAGIPDIEIPEVLGEENSVKKAKNEGGSSFIQLDSSASLKTGDSVRLNGSLDGLKDSAGNSVSGDTFFVSSKNSSGKEYQLYLTAEDAQNGTNALKFSTDNSVSNVSIQEVITPASTQKVTGSTTLGQINNRDDFSLKVNGEEFEFSADTTIDSVLSQINQSGRANVTASFDSQTGSISLVSKDIGDGEINVSGDLADTLALKGDGTTSVEGQDEIAGGSFIKLKSKADGEDGRIALSTGDKVQLNGSLSGLKDANGNAVSGDTFFVGSRNGSEKEFALFLTAEDAQNNTNALTFSKDNDLSNVSVQKVLSEAQSNPVSTSTTLGQLGAFGDVTETRSERGGDGDDGDGRGSRGDSQVTQSLSVNGRTFSFDSSSTIANVIDRINQSEGLNVTASFDSQSGSISLAANEAGAGEVTISGDLASSLGLAGEGTSSVSGRDEVVGGTYINLGAQSSNFSSGDKVQLNGSLTDANGQAVTGDFILDAREEGSNQFTLYRVGADGSRGDAVELAASSDLSNVSVQKVLAEARTEEVSTSTTLGSLNNLSSFSFSVNGASFDFNADSTIEDVINQINQSGDANVTASFNAETRSISVVNNQAGAGDVSVSGDLADRLNLTGSGATAVSGRDAVAGGSFIELNSASNGTLSTGDKIQLNGSLSGVKDANGNDVTGDTFFVGSRNGSDKEFALFLTAEDAQNNTNAVSFSEGTNLSEVSVQKVLAESSTSQVNANTKLGQLDNVGNFSFSVNGADFEFDADTTISTVLSRINGSSSAGVNATFNADTRQISFTNKNTGEGDVTVSGGLADRLGLTSSGAKAVSGQNAVATISGGPQDGRVISSRDNTLSTSESGVDGLTFTVRGTGSTTITSTAGGDRNVPDAEVVTEGIEEFFAQFNKVQAFLETNAEKGGKVFGDIANGLRGALREVFSNSAISGSVGSNGQSNNITIDSSSLSAGVSGGLDSVLNLFRGSDGAGFAAKTSSFLRSYSGATGTLSQEINRIEKGSSSLASGLASLNEKEENNRKRLNESLAGISQAVVSIQSQRSFLAGIGAPTAAQASTTRREGTTGLNLSGQFDQIQQKASDAGIETTDSSGNGFNLANDLSGIENFINGLFK